MINLCMPILNPNNIPVPLHLELDKYEYIVTLDNYKDDIYIYI